MSSLTISVSEFAGTLTSDTSRILHRLTCHPSGTSRPSLSFLNPSGLNSIGLNPMLFRNAPHAINLHASRPSGTSATLNRHNAFFGSITLLRAPTGIPWACIHNAGAFMSKSYPSTSTISPSWSILFDPITAEYSAYAPLSILVPWSISKSSTSRTSIPFSWNVNSLLACLIAAAQLTDFELQNRFAASLRPN